MHPVEGADAAILMLREKVHRLPVVNESNQLVGELMIPL